jgi:ligand-binding sensor domain-containing protein/DNA-binding CsgD family transcriptional regulator
MVILVLMRTVIVDYGRILLLVAACCCCETMAAQTPAGYSFEFYNSAHGLPSSEIIALAKDSKGFLWIGTSAGISRYDGYEFYNYNRSKEGDLLGYVNVLVADRDDKVWIGTDAGLFCHSGDEIKKVSAASHLPQGVNDILLESDGTAWLATENGPVKIGLGKTQTGPAENIQLANYVLPQWNHKNQTPDDRRIEHIKKAADGTVYMSDQQRVFMLKENSVELLHTMTDHGDPILSLFPISRSLLFFNTGETEIHKVENGMHTNIQHAALYKPGVDDELTGEWHVGSSGLYYFHPQTATASRYINILEPGVEVPRAMLKDNNFFWVASNTGLIKIKPSLFTQYDAGSIIPWHQDYYSFLQLKNGTLLLGANRGHLVEKKSIDFKLVQKSIVPSAEIKCLYEDESGQLWVGSGYQGLALISKNQVQRFTVENGLHDNSFSQFLKTSKGKLYAIGDHGMSEILVDKNGAVSFKKYYYASTVSKHAKFYSGIELPDGSILTGGEEGLFCLKNDSLRPVLIDKKTIPVKCIIKDGYDTIWIATDGEGIWQCVYNNKNDLEIVRQLTEADGLRTSHYLSLLADKENNIWAASPKGLTFIGRHGKYKDNIINFDQWDGFTKPGYYTITLYQDRDSVIWAGTTFGFTSFKPGAAFFSADVPAVFINGIQSLKNPEAITDTNNSYSYNNNAFHFSFAALDYANQENIRYFYKLDGLDTNWTDAGALRNVTYENLSPRSYTFRVKAINNKGRWSEKDATYSFHITPPFWQKGWFLLLSVGIALGLLLLFIKLREAKQAKLRKAEQQATEKEMEVLRLSKDVATSQLTALRMQMNPHFIFNALNSIQYYILQGNVVEANKYLSKFSKLQREILHCSNQPFISLEKELEILTAYLQLEQHRFGGNFTYKIDMTEEIEPVEIMIPPMILQPFVENSIWHGLMPVQTERMLSIYFELESDDILLVAIRDNGIGRAASTRLKGGGQINSEHESKGMLMIKQRLQLLQQQYDKPFDVSISDITDTKGDVMGTHVELTFFIGNKTS